jgi:hypothetical protein
VVHRYVMYGGTGISGPLSWSWSGSWIGRVDPMGRQVWFTQFGPASTNVAKRSFTVLIPYSSVWGNYPELGDKIELKDSDGVSKGTFRVNFSTPYEIDGDVWQVECNVEELQP